MTDTTYGRANIIDVQAGRVVQTGRPVPSAQGALTLWKADAQAETSPAGSFMTPWANTRWRDTSFNSLADEGYRFNSAVFSCVQVWANTFPEPPLTVSQETDANVRVQAPAHPLRALVKRPNAAMGEDDFWSYVITYMAIGGNAYVWKERSNGGKVIGLWPMHDGVMQPIAGAGAWCDGYVYKQGTADQRDVPLADVVHLKWAVDPRQPVKGIGPLKACARAVDADNEMLRYEYALLTNDAVARTIISLAEPITATGMRELKERFERQYGGENRGGVAVIEGAEATITRVGANLQELAVEALHDIPESRIAAAFGVPAAMAGLNVGIKRPTALGSSNDELVAGFVARRVVPMWRRVAAQFEAQMLPEWGEAPGLSVEFDTSHVQALQEDEQGLITTLNGAWASGWMTLNEVRARASLPPLVDGDVRSVSGMALEQPATVGDPKGLAARESKGLTAAQSQRRALADRAKLEKKAAADIEDALAHVKARVKARLA